MSREIVQKSFNELANAIQFTIGAKKYLPTLILTFSTIDFLAWLNRPVSHPDVTKCDFISWVDQFLLPNSNLPCSPIDLYAARCGILHSYQAESKLSREGKAMQIWYAWGEGDATKLMTMIHRASLEKKAVAVQVEKLIEALVNGFSRFLAHLDANPDHAKIVYERACKKLFSNIPYELI